MMIRLTCDVIKALGDKTLSVAESCTGGMIGAAITSIPGSSKVFKGGVISYTNEIKSSLLGVSKDLLEREGAVSLPVAQEMAVGVRTATSSDYGLSVTGLAGPGGDEYGNPVGTVFVGYADEYGFFAKKFLFDGDRESVRLKAVNAALQVLMDNL